MADSPSKTPTADVELKETDTSSATSPAIRKEETVEVREPLVAEKNSDDDLESNKRSQQLLALRLKLATFYKAYIKDYYVHRTSRIRVIMDFIMTFIILYNLFEVPYLACFENYTHVGFLVVHIFLDLIAYFNMFLHFFDVVEQKGLPVYSRKLTIKTYAQFYLAIDFISYLPVDWFVLNIPLLRLFRMLSLIRFRIYFATIEEKLVRWINPLYLRLINLMLTLILIIHVFACFLYLQQTTSHQYGNFMMPDDSMDLWIYNTQMNPTNGGADYDITVRFVQYIGVLTIMIPVTVGYASLNPQDNAAISYCLVCVLVGASVYSILLGTVGDIVQALDRADQVFRDKMDNLSDYLRYRGVTGAVQRDSRKFYTILQRGKRGLDHDIIMGDLDVSVKRKIAQYLHKDLVAKVPLFAKCGELFVEAICQKLKYSLLLKDYYCVTAGDKGREMFFLGKGSVQVVSPDGSAIYATLNSGSFFGEIALVEETRRTASIRAADLCELFVLYKEDFDTVVKRFPAAVLIMKEEVEERKRQLAAKKEAEQKKLQSAATKLKFVTQLKAATPEKEEEKPLNSSRFKLDMSRLRRGSNPNNDVGSARSTTPRSGNLLTRLMTRRGTDASVVEAPTFSASSSFASQRSDQSPRDESPINSARSVVTARSNKVEPEPKPE